VDRDVFKGLSMKITCILEIKRRRITVTSSVNEISTYQHGNRVRGDALFCSPPPHTTSVFRTDI
jgi:hypothetical protein